MTLTKEQIEMYASAADATQTFEMDKGKLIAVEPKHMQELARIALAALTAEPVAWIIEGGKNSTPCHLSSHKEYVEAYPDRDVTPLYTAPPAPVSVPAAMEMDDDFDSAFEHGKAVGWNAYRAAMLQSFGNSEQLNSPVIQDGWVACSERMPAIGVPVITCCGDVVQYAVYAWDGKEWQDWYEEYDKLPSDIFTHWHSRPAAPQQEVRGE
ncbi:DUF551 domain-containing protein [Escherichia coli]